MSTTIEMIVLKKIDGKPYHLLTEDEQRNINQVIEEQVAKGEYKEPEEIFQAGNQEALITFLHTSTENIEDTVEVEGGLYFYIADHNVDEVIASTKQEIDRLFENADRYTPETYESYGDLGTFASFLQSVEQVADKIRREAHYLIVDVG